MRPANTFSLIFLSFTWVAMFVFVGCSTPPKQQSPKEGYSKASAQAVALYKSAVQMRTSNPSKSLDLLVELIKNHSDSSLADDSYLLMGDLLVQKQDVARAQAAYNKVIHFPGRSEFETDARLKLARLFSQEHAFDKARAVLREGLDHDDLDTNSRIQLLNSNLVILRESNLPIPALKNLVELYNLSNSQSEREVLKIQAENIIGTQLTQTQMNEIVADSSFGFVRGPTLYRLALSHYEQGDYSRARKYFGSAATVLSGTEYAQRAEDYIRQIESREHVQHKVIGAILPLTGRYARIGQRTLKGLQLGLGIYGGGSSDFKLSVIDSEGNASLARRAVERLVTEDNVIGIIGGLLSKTAAAIGTKAQELGVPFIALSQKSGLTQIGDHVFRNAVTSEMQVRHLVDVAMRIKRFSKFAILYPNDPYGVEYANLFWDEVLARGGEIRAAQVYDPKETDFRYAVQRLVGTYYVDDRSDEYRLRYREWEKKSGFKTDRSGAPKDLLPPIVDFDAVFVPDSIKAAGQIGPMLSYNDVSAISLLGTNLWDTPEVIERLGKGPNAIFVDSFLPEIFGSPKGKIFENQFKEIFGSQPESFEILGYESAQVFKRLIEGGERTREGLRHQMLSLKNIDFPSGKVSMSSLREIRRPLTTLTIREQKIAPLLED